MYHVIFDPWSTTQYWVQFKWLIFISWCISHEMHLDPTAMYEFLQLYCVCGTDYSQEITKGLRKTKTCSKRKKGFDLSIWPINIVCVVHEQWQISTSDKYLPFGHKLGMYSKLHAFAGHPLTFAVLTCCWESVVQAYFPEKHQNTSIKR